MQSISITRVQKNPANVQKNPGDDWPEKCDKCDKSFAGKHFLAQHKAYVHEGMVFKCPYCSKECAEKSTLKRHLKKSHPKIKNWNFLKIIKRTKR